MVNMSGTLMEKVDNVQEIDGSCQQRYWNSKKALKKHIEGQSKKGEWHTWRNREFQREMETKEEKKKKK